MSAPDWRDQAAFNASLPKTTQTVGIYLETVNGLAVVNVFDDTITCRFKTHFRPVRGDGVILEFFGNTVRLLGPTSSKANIGKVTTVGHPLLTVSVEGKSYQLPYTVAYETQSNPPKVGDTVAIDWSGGGYVTGSITATPAGGTATPKLTTAQHPFTFTLYAKQAGSYDTAKARWVSGDLYCDSSHQAAWFYGNTIRNQLRDDAWIQSVEIYLSLRVRQGAVPTLGKHSDASEKAGGVSSSSTFTVKHRTGWIPLPVAWGIDWRANVGGVTITGGSSIYRGLGSDRQSGKIRIRGRQ